MARTGISIQVSNTQLGSEPRVNANTMLVCVGAVATTGGTIQFELDTPYMIQSTDDLKTLGIDADNNPDLFKEVTDFYAPKAGVNNTGTILWIVAPSESAAANTHLADYVRSTVVNGFQYRPRNLVISQPLTGGTPTTVEQVQAVIDELYIEGFSTVAIIGSQTLGGDISTIATTETLPDLSLKQAFFVGMVIVTDIQGARACAGKLGGYIASLAVGTSIGDGTESAFSDSMFFVDSVDTPCARVKLTVVNVLGDKQYLYVRTRPPKNGLWWNDGATAVAATMAISTLENGRVVASIVDDLREFFIPYINQRVPVSTTGDIDGTYKQVVIDNADSKVIRPYVEDGSISGARILLAAENNSMTTTKTWRVKLQLLDAPTLRWVDGYVFYVSSLD